MYKKITKILGFFWAGGFFLYLFVIHFNYKLDLHATPTLVVLTGGGGTRIKEGFELLEKDKDSVLFISGVEKKMTHEKLGRHFDVPAPKYQKRVVLGFKAKTTVGNAKEVSNWVRDKKITEIKLITSYYHMPRSMGEFMFRYPGLTIRPHAVFPKKPDAFFKKVCIWLLEYNKFLVSYVKILILKNTQGNVF